MKKSIIISMLLVAFAWSTTLAVDLKQSLEFSNRDGNRTVRTVTTGNDNGEMTLRRKLPIRNPNILAQVLWVDRNHENAIAEDVTVTPDGSGIFAGWWLNNERFSAYASAGLESPAWTYREINDWQMPVASSNSHFAGTGSGLPGYIWQKDSPLFEESVEFDEGYNGSGVSFSGDGTLAAFTATVGSSDAILIVYDFSLGDTLFTRRFTPTNGQYGVDFSADGSRIVVSNYGGLLVYSVPEGDLVGTIGNYSQNTARISGDGMFVVIGTFNGTVYLYQWDGSQYGLLWSEYTGHDWVTAVDVSTDGSTAACGTMDFQNNQVAGGKFMLFDVPTGDVLIDYDEYGDEVGSVALSSDGRYAIAGCWGKYGQTFGDVVTCFIRDTDVPIFRLLDDIDESGSIFGVAISDSGRYAAAGGKAVHAREWGNGGMLYSIMIRDLLNSDVAIASIDEPGEFVNPGEDVIPTATYINVGTNDASFTARCVITDIDSGEEVYNSTYDVENLSSFSTSIVYFSPQFSMPEEGRYRMVFSAEMSSDEDLSNNDLSLVLRSWHDVKALSVVSPFDEVTVGWPVTGIAEYRNLGSYYENVDIEMVIYDSNEDPVFSTLSTIFNLGPYQTEEVYFESWVPDANGQYRVEFNAQLPDDYFPDDNIISKSFQVTDEMIYDDGAANVSIWVNLYPYSVNRKFAQRFEPNISAPFSITNFRMFIGPINYDGYFDYIGFTEELNGAPDTANYFAMIENPPLSGPGAWSSFDLNAYVDSERPIYAVIHWPDRDDAGPYIGADNTGIVDQQSYWYSDSDGWNLYLFYDWMMRMTLEGATGTEFEYVSGIPDRFALGQNYPNPFNPSTTIEFALPNESHASIELFNVLGEKVKTLIDGDFDAGVHSVIWDGKTDSGLEVSSGVYYYRLTIGERRFSRKMMLLK